LKRLGWFVKNNPMMTAKVIDFALKTITDKVFVAFVSEAYEDGSVVVRTICDGSYDPESDIAKVTGLSVEAVGLQVSSDRTGFHRQYRLTPTRYSRGWGCQGRDSGAQA